MKKLLMERPKTTTSEPCYKQHSLQGFVPSCIAFDSWFGALDNLKLIRSYGWIWLTRLKRNRLVNRDNPFGDSSAYRTGNRRVDEVELSETGTVVHLKGYGFIKVFKIVAQNKDTGAEFTSAP